MRLAALGIIALLACAPPAPLADRFSAAAPGTIIRASREEGIRALMHIAATEETELGMLYLPELGVWMAHTTERRPEGSRLDLTYSLRVETGSYEFWHTHNRAVIERRQASGRSYWVAPSSFDLEQLYAFGCLGLEVRNGIATERSAISYQGTGYERWGDPALIAELATEAKRMQDAFESATPSELADRAQSYEGMVRMTWELPITRTSP